jgi:hypothetical protein
MPYAIARRDQLAPLEQAVVDQYPAVYAAALFWRQVNLMLSTISPDGRRLLARVLRAAYLACDDALRQARDLLVAPQLVLIAATAQKARDIALFCRRYADLSQGPNSVTLSSAAQAALAEFDRYDPALSPTLPFDGQLRFLDLVYGVTIGK